MKKRGDSSHPREIIVTRTTGREGDQNHISDENSIKNAEIIFENNDSIPKFKVNEDLTIAEEVNFELLISRNFYKN